MKQYKTVDEYIKNFSPQVQTLLQTMRQTIQKAAPDAKEKIAYGIPTFTYHGNLVHYAAFTHHIGFYPTPGAIVEFKKELAGYKQAKGSVQFPINDPLPLALVSKIVEYRVKQNENR